MNLLFCSETLAILNISAKAVSKSRAITPLGTHLEQGDEHQKWLFKKSTKRKLQSTGSDEDNLCSSTWSIPQLLAYWLISKKAPHKIINRDWEGVQNARLHPLVMTMKYLLKYPTFRSATPFRNLRGQGKTESRRRFDEMRRALIQPDS